MTEFTSQEAYLIGVAAFAKGDPSAPAASKSFMKRLAARVNPEFGSALPLLEAYAKGWHTQHAESTKDLISAMEGIPTSHIKGKYDALDTPEAFEFLVDLSELCLKHANNGSPEAIALRAYADTMLKRKDRMVQT
jgi:hypothetical protein